MNKWLPIKVRPDRKARGWKPEAGWYCWRIETLSTDLSKQFASKKEAQAECDRRNKLAFIIYSSMEKLYWSNEDGWVDKASATVFTVEERNQFNLPIGGTWKKIGL